MSEKRTLSLETFQIAEIRNYVFQAMSQASLASCARVCVDWADSALDLLWKNLDSLEPLLSILCPLEKLNDGYTHFTRKIRDGDWERLYKYSSRVRQLKINGDVSLSSDTLEEIFRKRTRLCLTPNLSGLEVYNPNLAVFSQVFMHTGLIRLVLCLPTDADQLEESIDGTKSRTPELENVTFYVNTQIPINIVETELSAFIIGHQKLKAIHLPYLTTALFSSIAQIKALETIGRTHYSGEMSLGMPFSVDSSIPSMHLTYLSVTASFLDIIQALDRLTSLQTLNVLVRHIESAAMLQTFFRAISQLRKTLTSLDVQGIPHNFNFASMTNEVKASCHVNQAILALLSPMDNLVSLAISWPLPLTITKEDLSHLLPTLSNLQSLYLNCSPVVLDDPPTLKLEALHRIRKWCPRLLKLGLFLNCKNTTFNPQLSKYPLNLTNLNLGLSLVEPTDFKLAYFLSNYCSPSCEFEKGRSTWIEQLGDLMAQQYGNGYMRGRWDGELVHITNTFQAFRKLRREREAELTSILNDRDAAIRKSNALTVERDLLVERLKEVGAHE